MDQKMQFRESIKNYLCDQGIYNTIKSQIAANVMAKLMSRQIEENTFQIVDLPNDDQTQAYVYELLMFLKEYGLVNTLKILMMEARINIDNAKESASRSPPKSPVKAQMDKLRGVLSGEQPSQVPIQPQAVTEIPDFDFETEDLIGAPQHSAAESKQKRPELAKVVDHDRDVLGKIEGELPKDEAAHTPKKKKKSRKHKELDLDNILEQYDVDNPNNDSDGFDDIETLENEVEKETPKKHHKKHKHHENQSDSINKQNASLEQINDLDDQKRTINKIQDLNKQVMDKISSSAVGQEIDTNPKDEEQKPDDLNLDIDLNEIDQFDDLNSDNDKNVVKPEEQADLNADFGDFYDNFEENEQNNAKQTDKPEKVDDLNDFSDLNNFDNIDLDDAREEKEKNTEAKQENTFDDLEYFYDNESKDEAKETPAKEEKKDNDQFDDLGQFDDLMDLEDPDDADDKKKTTEKPKTDSFDDDFNDLDNIDKSNKAKNSGANIVDDNLDDLANMEFPDLGSMGNSKGNTEKNADNFDDMFTDF